MTQERTQQLSKSMLPKRIMEGDVRKFKIIGAGEVDSMSGLPSFPAGKTVEGVTTVFDKEKGEMVIIKNITGKRLSKDKEGKDIVEEVISPAIFDNYGICLVDHTQYETYLFLARSNRCGTNPFRDKSVAAEWEEILPVNAKEKEQFIRDLKYQALSIIKTGDIKEVLAIGKVLADKRLVQVNLNGNPTDVRRTIESLCDTNPTEVIRASKQMLPKIKLDIQDAVNCGEIEFQHDGNTWVWYGGIGESKVIHKISPGQDPLEELAKHLLAEEEEMKKKKVEERTETQYQKIKSTLKELSVEAN